MNRYQEAGVDVNAGYELVNRIKAAVKSTDRSGVVGGIGSFGGMFDLGELHLKHPALVSGTDGVGTKLLIAQKHLRLYCRFHQQSQLYKQTNHKA